MDAHESQQHSACPTEHKDEDERRFHIPTLLRSVMAHYSTKQAHLRFWDKNRDSVSHLLADGDSCVGLLRCAQVLKLLSADGDSVCGMIVRQFLQEDGDTTTASRQRRVRVISRREPQSNGAVDGATAHCHLMHLTPTCNLDCPQQHSRSHPTNGEAERPTRKRARGEARILDRVSEIDSKLARLHAERNRLLREVQPPKRQKLSRHSVVQK